MISNRTKLAPIVAGLSLVAMLAAPFAAMAETNSVTPRDAASGQATGRMAAPTVSGFCEAVDKRGDAMLSMFEKMNGALNGKRGEHDSRHDMRRGEHADQLAKSRDLQEKRIDAIVAKLMEKAETPEQKAAVEAFHVSLDKALASRHTAVDKANTDYAAGIAKARADRKTSVDAAVATFKKALAAAIDKAKSDCAAGKDDAAVRKAMMASIETARGKLKTDLAAVEKITAVVKTLTAAHHAAIEKAFADFKAAVDAAHKALKAAKLS